MSERLAQTLLVMMFPVIMVVMMGMATVSTALWLKCCLYLGKICAKAKEHILDHMVGPNAKNVVSNFRRQVPVSQMPRKAHELMGIFVSDFDNQLRSGLNLQPPPIFQLQAISIGHRNRFRKVEKDVFALIRSQANSATMTRVEIESESACCFFLRPVSGGAMNGSVVHGHPQYRK
jgi:hypothetical protein